MDKPIAKLECFEPAGCSLEITEADLLGHTLAIGSTGSGKTSRLVTPLISQIIGAENRIGLCILDTKADGTVEQILKRACFEAERQNDLKVIKADNGNYLNLFSEMPGNDMEGVDRLAALLESTIPRDNSNKYWENTFAALLRQSLRLVQLSKNIDWGYTPLMQQIISYLLLHKLRDSTFTDVIDELKANSPHANHKFQLIVDEVVATHRAWETLDSRTRSILQSMAVSLTGPMNTNTAHHFFDGEVPIDIAAAVRNKDIVLISIDGVRAPETTKLVSRALKGLFYDAVLQQDSQQPTCPTAGLVLDDWPICITAGSGNRYSDIEALAMIRSRGGFIVAATQSFAAIDIATDSTTRKAAVANFANLLFFRGRDPEVDALAAAYCGQRKEYLVDISRHEQATGSAKQGVTMRHEREIRVPAVPIGALAKLNTGEAYAIIGSELYSQPLCLVPDFFTRT